MDTCREQWACGRRKGSIYKDSESQGDGRNVMDTVQAQGVELGTRSQGEWGFGLLWWR